MDIHTAIFGRHPSFPDCNSESDWQNRFDTLEYQRAKSYVIRRLASQPYHSRQLAKLLQERLVSTSTASRIIKECVDKGFINDDSWIESFIRQNHKKMGVHAIMRKLQAKGLINEEIQAIYEKWMDPEKEKQSIERLLQTKYRKKNLNNFAERQKVVASLMRKGFSIEAIRSSFGIIPFY